MTEHKHDVVAQAESKHDPVEYPKWYTTHPSGIEVIEYTRLLPFEIGSAVKYVMRRDLKGNAVQDLSKALWYLDSYLVRPYLPSAGGELNRLLRSVIKFEPNRKVKQILEGIRCWSLSACRANSMADAVRQIKIARGYVQELLKEYKQ